VTTALIGSIVEVERDTPCPCEACDQPWRSDAGITEALAPGEDIDELTAEEMTAIEAAA